MRPATAGWALLLAGTVGFVPLMLLLGPLAVLPAAAGLLLLWDTPRWRAAVPWALAAWAAAVALLFLGASLTVGTRQGALARVGVEGSPVDNFLAGMGMTAMMVPPAMLLALATGGWSRRLGRASLAMVGLSLGSGLAGLATAGNPLVLGDVVGAPALFVMLAFPLLVAALLALGWGEFARARRPAAT